MYPRVKVRVQEEEEDHFPPPNDSVSSLFSRRIQSLSKQEKENRINSPPSNPISRIKKAYVTSPAPKSLSASKDAGIVKNNKQIGKDTKSNVKASSVPPPRAVLSSPDNDEMIGTRNKLNYARSAASKRRPAEQVKPASQAQINLNPSRNVTRSSPNIGKGPKTENVNLSLNIARSSPKISKGSKTDIVNLNPNTTQSSPNIREGSKTENRGLAGSIRKDPSKHV